MNGNNNRLSEKLTITLKDIAQKYTEYDKAGLAIKSYCSDLSTVRIAQPREIVEQYLQTYIEEKVKAANERASNRSKTNIKSSALPEPYDNYRFPHVIKIGEGQKDYAYEAEINTLIRYINANWDDAVIDNALCVLEETIEGEGFRDAAKRIGCDLLEMLIRDNWSNRGPLKYKKQKGKIIIKSRFLYGNGYSEQQKVNEFIGHLEAIELETGVTGTAETLKKYFDVLVLNNQTSIASGTKFTTNDACHITAYKQHANLHFAPEVFESLYSFMGEYAPDGYLVRAVAD